MKQFLPLFLLALAPIVLRAQEKSQVFDNLTMPSKILKMERKYSIYLPPDYETSQRSYPVLYLLHGAGDDQTGWVQFGEVKHIADKAIGEGTATPMIIVMPDANTGKRGYFNDIKGEWRYEDFFFEEFIPFIEKKYRIRNTKQYRAVAGLSMGGGGSFMYALHRPQMFSSACPLSAYIGPLSIEEARTNYKKADDGLSDAQILTYFNRHSALPLVENMPDSLKNAVRWYIDVGDDDFLYEGNALVHIAMKKNGVPHEYRVRDGGHTWSYWRTALPEVLRFVTEGFHR